MVKKICFFSGGFAFNRLIRMRYYEKIFPEDAEIFLFTTNKYEDNDKEKKKWDLKRTKIVVSDYHPIKTMFDLRRFCIKNNIDRLVNLGAPGAGIPFIIATLTRKTDYLIGYYGEVIKHKRARGFLKTIKKFFLYPQYILVAQFAKKLVFTDIDSYKKAHLLFLSKRKRIFFGAAPVNTELFTRKTKALVRKKLKLPQSKEIIIRVGRINYGKCGDILTKLIEKNPDKYFILIGEWLEKEVLKIKKENLLHIEKKTSKELVDYYNASDLCFCLHRHGNGIGITAEEALACGVPVILPTTLTMPKSKAVILADVSLDSTDRKTKEFFSLSKEDREKISKESRKYAEKYCSDEVWKEEYSKFHLD
jgi:glycosyltransferase involved in cell wall biosynthesis